MATSFSSVTVSANVGHARKLSATGEPALR